MLRIAIIYAERTPVKRVQIVNGKADGIDIFLSPSVSGFHRCQEQFAGAVRADAVAFAGATAPAAAWPRERAEVPEFAAGSAAVAGGAAPERAFVRAGLAGLACAIAEPAGLSRRGEC